MVPLPCRCHEIVCRAFRGGRLFRLSSGAPAPPEPSHNVVAGVDDARARSPPGHCQFGGDASYQSAIPGKNQGRSEGIDMHARYPNVFSPIKLGPVELPNRYYFSPHGLPLTVGCGPSTDLVAYCTERVRDGGCGLVILSCTVHDRGATTNPALIQTKAFSVPRLADAVHAAGGGSSPSSGTTGTRPAIGSRSRRRPRRLRPRSRNMPMAG